MNERGNEDGVGNRVDRPHLEKEAQAKLITGAHKIFTRR